jgi:lipopolysaccharide assembly protein A
MLGAAALLFALQNTEVVALSFLGAQFESSLALLVLVSLGVGMLISILASIPAALSTSFRIMGLKKQNKELVREVELHRQAQVVEQSAPVVDLR